MRTLSAMKKTLIAVSVVVVAAVTAVGALGCPLSECPLCDHAEQPTAGELKPHEPVHAMFAGCASACGSRAAGDRAQAKRQPDARPGDLTFCLVSGAVFRIDEKATVREVNGRRHYFCCDACAGYFDQHREEVLMKRSLARLSADAPLS